MALLNFVKPEFPIVNIDKMYFRAPQYILSCPTKCTFVPHDYNIVKCKIVAPPAGLL